MSPWHFNEGAHLQWRLIFIAAEVYKSASRDLSALNVSVARATSSGRERHADKSR